MKKRLQKTLRHAWAASLILLSLSFLPFSAQGQCDYKIVGYDSYGDGWNGASIDVDVAGNVTNFTLSSGSIDSISIPSYNGDFTTFTFNSGNWDSEITFDIYAPDGTLLGNYGPSPATGVFLTNVSNATCVPPCDYKIVGYDSWGDGWNGASIDIDVAGAVTNFTLANGSIDSISIASYSGDITTFTFNSGSFDSEITFDIYAPDGTLLGSYGPSPATGVFLTDTSNSVCTAPACQAPASLALNNLGADSASFTWTPMGSAPANGYDWEVVPQGNSQGTGVVVSGNTSTPSVSVTGLMANTPYDFYVRANCGSTGTSSYAGPVSFKTFCSAPAATTLPFTEDFEAGTDTTLTATPGNIFCGATHSWIYSASTSGGRVRFGADAPTAASGSGALVMDDPSFSSVINNTILTLNLSSYSSDTSLSMAFDIADFGDESDAEDKIFIRGSVSDSWVVLYDWQGKHGSSFATVTGLDIDSALSANGQSPSSTFQVRFGQTDNSTYSGDGLGIDNLFIGQVTCPKPLNLSVFGITSSAASITFTPGGATNFNIQYGATGFALGSGTTINAANDTATITGLTPQTTYDVYVRDSCGAGDVSVWEGPVTFSTACLAVNLPYSMNFPTATFPTCWSRNNSNEALISSSCGTNNGNYLQVNGVGGVYAQTPIMDASNAPMITASWYYRAGCNNNPESGDAINVDYWNGSQWVTIKTYDGGTAPSTWTFDSAVLPGGNSDLQIRFDMQSGSGSGFDDYDFDSLSFASICGAPTATTLPFTEDFEGGTDTTLTATPGNIFCGTSHSWQYEASTNGGRVRFGADAPTAASGSGALVMDDPSFSSVINNTILTLNLSSYSSDTSLSMAFDIADFGDESDPEDKIYVRGSSTDSWVVIYDWQGKHSSSFATVTGLDIDSALSANGQSPSSTFQVRFGQNDNSTYSGDGLGIDNLFIGQVTCPKPLNLSVFGVSTNSASVTFTPGGASNFNIQYGATGFTLGSGTTINAANDTATITGLTPQTTYDVYVRDSCGAGDVSVWEGPVTFSTACLAVSLPYSMNFPTATFPTCWSRNNSNEALISSSCGTNNGNYLQVNGVAGVNATTPLVDASAQASVKVSWYYRAGCNNNPESGDAINVDYWNGSQWVTIKTYDGGTAPSTWTADSAAVLASNADFQIRFDMQSGSGSGFDDYDFDSLMIEAGPSCLASTNLREISSGATTATVTWMAGNSSNWIVEYGPTGFTPGTGTTLNVSNDTVTITGLTTGTIYDFYVTDSCGAGSISSQSGPGTFSTAACLASAQCSYTLNLYDTFGDGWNGNTVDVFQNGVSSGSFGASFTSGDSLTGLSLNLCPNQTIDFILNEGSFSGEIEFFVINPAGDTVASHLSSSGLSTGDTLASFTTAPAANAGMGGSDTVCTSAGSIDLTSYLGTYDQGGTWTDLSSTGALTDSLFNASAVGSGTYNFTYSVSSSNGCSSDSAGVTITVDNLNNAGADSSITACSNAGAVTLNNYVGTSGGSWVDLDNSGAFNPTSSDFTPMASMAGSTFRFAYIVGGNTCPDDSAIVSVLVDAPANAGAMAADTLCDTAMVVDLNNYLDTAADAGGSWVDVNGTGALSGSDFDPSMVTPSATYTFRYVVSAPCGADSTTVSLYVDFCSSGIEEYLNGQVSLFPNPAQEVVHIEATGTLTNMEVTLYDAQGKAILQTSLPTNGTKQLDVSKLPAGLYTVSIQSDQGRAVKRFVKE